MRVGWLCDSPGYLGGAELTMAEFAAAAPEDVEVVTCTPGSVAEGLSTYVVGNCHSYEPDEIPPGSIRYHHDVSKTRADEATYVRHLFCSPLQRDRMGMEGPCIPPAIDLERFRSHTGADRRGAVCIGRMSYGKGAERLAEYEEPVDVYSTVPLRSEGNLRYLGPTSDPAETLAHYETFVFLPTAIEPFGRAVVEAWAAGLTLVINRNVGAAHWIANAQEGLHSAAEDFWQTVKDASVLCSGRGK